MPGHGLRPQQSQNGALAAWRFSVVRLPIDFFVIAVIAFAGGVTAAPWLVDSVIGFFYGAGILALVHVFTLGWITTAIMGVMYRYVPALTRRPLPFPRLAIVQLILFLIGASGMVAHFAIGNWAGTWSAAIVVVISVLLFAVNMFACLGPQVGRGVAETGMFIAITFLLVAAGLGLTLALDKTFYFLGGRVLTNLAGHAQLAAVGWVTLAICSVSYRMIPAFLLPRIQLPRSALWQIYALAGGIVGLALTLIFGLGGLTFWSAEVTLSLVMYLVIMARLVSTRRMPLDWTARHAMAGCAWLMIAAALGIALSRIGAQSETGNRLVAAYGALGLLGFMSNFIMGMSYHLFAGFVTRVRTAAGWPAVTAADLSLPRPRLFVFLSFNTGMAALAAGFFTDMRIPALAGTIVIAVGGLVYSATMLWTLSYAYRRTIPAAAANAPLRIIPN
jgi:hypothetical protein